MRLNKYLASHLDLGRRAIDDLITKGRVKVNGQTAILGAQVSSTDKIEVDDKLFNSEKGDYLYLMLNKPVGYLCSRRSQGGDPTIYELLPNAYLHLKSVGRLDKNTSGLLLLTNDGEFAHQLTHPKFAKVKKYQVELDKPLQPLHQQMINDIGIDLPDGKSKLQLEKLDNSKLWQVTMHEGRNRQIRRTFNALGYDVVTLHRTQFGNWHLQNLKSGQIEQIRL